MSKSTTHVFVLMLAMLASAAARGTALAQCQTPPPPQHEEPAVAEVVVVTASRCTEQLLNAPATMTVLTDEVIGKAPIQGVTDLLRLVPGLNTVQTSARDVNVTSRAATGTLADSMLVLLDGRSIYQDFFGFVAWDFLPIDVQEIKQIEVIRGPASAVWGANAMTGVINVITRTPREMSRDSGGNAVTIGFGGFNRDVTGRDQNAGTLFYVNGSHADAVDDKWSYKVSAGFF